MVSDRRLNSHQIGTELTSRAEMGIPRGVILSQKDHLQIVKGRPLGRPLPDAWLERFSEIGSLLRETYRERAIRRIKPGSEQFLRDRWEGYSVSVIVLSTRVDQHIAQT